MCSPPRDSFPSITIYWVPFTLIYHPPPTSLCFDGCIPLPCVDGPSLIYLVLCDGHLGGSNNMAVTALVCSWFCHLVHAWRYLYLITNF